MFGLQNNCYGQNYIINIVPYFALPSYMYAGEIEVFVLVDNKEGAWVGCTCYDKWNKATDYEPVKVSGIGKSSVKFWWAYGSRSSWKSTPEYKKCIISLWEKKYNKNEGPDPNNYSGKKNGYYMWGLLDKQVCYTVYKGNY